MKKFLKTFVSAVSAAALLMGFAACSSDSSDNNVPQSKPVIKPDNPNLPVEEPEINGEIEADATAYIIDENETAKGFVSATNASGVTVSVSTANVPAKGQEGGYSGTGFLDSLGGGSVVYSINSPKEQYAKVLLRYAYWGDKAAARVAQVIVNGKKDKDLLYCNWAKSKQPDTLRLSNEIIIHLDEGENQIRVVSVAKGTVCHIATGDEPGIVYPEGYEANVGAWGNYADGTADGNLPNIDYIQITAKGLSCGANSLTFSKIVSSADIPAFGNVVITPAQDFYKDGTEVTVTAVPVKGFAFDSWYESDVTAASFKVTVNSDLRFIAHFIPAGYKNTGLEGYATVSDDKGTPYTISGGAGGQEITLATLADLTTYKNQISGADPYIIHVAARITTDPTASEHGNKSLSFDLGSNKTLIGAAGKDYGFKNIEVKVTGKNVIVKNLHFGDVIGDDTWSGKGNDAMAIKGGDHVWIDHCEFSSSLEPRNNDDGSLITFDESKFHVDLEGENTTVDVKWAKDFYDGLLDISEESRFVSVSNSYFHDHWKACLCGGSNDNATTQPQGSQVRLTMYNNYFENIHARQPLFRFGKAHVYSSYFKGVADGTSTGIEVRAESEVYVDNCCFENLRSGREVGCWNSSSGLGAGKWYTEGNIGKADETYTMYAPPYNWTKTSAADSKAKLPSKAGISK